MLNVLGCKSSSKEEISPDKLVNDWFCSWSRKLKDEKTIYQLSDYNIDVIGQYQFYYDKLNCEKWKKR